MQRKHEPANDNPETSNDNKFDETLYRRNYMRKYMQERRQIPLYWQREKARARERAREKAAKLNEEKAPEVKGEPKCL